MAGFAWQAQTGMVNLGAGSSFFLEFAGINDQGQIVGSARSSPDQAGSGFIYSPGTGVSIINIPGTPVNAALAINNNGQLVLSSPVYPNSLFYTPGQAPVEIQGANLTGATALAINNGGAVVGEASANQGLSSHAFLWTQAAGMIDLTPGTDAFGVANAINSEGDVVGIEGISFQSQNSFLYQNGVMYNLDTLLGASGAGWSALVPEGINDSGQIVGSGFFNGQVEAFIMSPGASPSAVVPEPASLAMLALERYRPPPPPQAVMGESGE